MKKSWLLGVLMLLAVLPVGAQQVMYSNLKELVENRGDTVTTLKIEKRTKNQIYLMGGADYRITVDDNPGLCRYLKSRCYAVRVDTSLHACDTATDYAPAKAVEWGAEVILSVPCCQHEVNKQIKNEMLEPVLRYGILKERMSALITDAVRADLLESKGYDTQILEFIDMEHTPKNLLIRAVRTGKRSDQGKVEKMLAALNIHPTLDRLLNEKEQEGSVR